nr:amidohydrolase family protein [Rhodoglobus vestalii]
MGNIPYYRSFEERSMDAFLDEMDEARIDIAVVTGHTAPAPYFGVDNDDIAEIVDKWPDRFIGFGAIDTNSSDPAELVRQVEKIADRGFRGIGIMFGWADTPIYDDDQRLYPMYEKCAELGMIVTTTSSIFVGPDLSYSDPIHIQRVARDFPDLPIVVSHGSWPWATELCGVAFQNSNVYLMPDIYLNVPGIPGASEYVIAANNFASYRTLHASAYPVRPLQDSIDGLMQSGLHPGEITDRVLGGNAARLLGLDASAARF